MPRRSDIAKLVSDSRNRWRQSENYQAVKKASKVAGMPGWYNCAACLRKTEVIKIDHITPIGKQPVTLNDFGAWLVKLFCSTENLQALCNECHKIKSKSERREGKYK